MGLLTSAQAALGGLRGPRKVLRWAVLAPLFAMLAACEGTGALLDPALGEPRRCSHCGWIESKQEISPAILEPHAFAIYEYKVRMANGSSSLFREKTSATWRVGERLIVIGAKD